MKVFYEILSWIFALVTVVMGVLTYAIVDLAIDSSYAYDPTKIALVLGVALIQAILTGASAIIAVAFAIKSK